MRWSPGRFEPCRDWAALTPLHGAGQRRLAERMCPDVFAVRTSAPAGLRVGMVGLFGAVRLRNASALGR